MTLDVLEDEVVRADVVDLTDVRVAQRGDCPRFLIESSSSLVMTSDACRKNLDCDVALQPCVARPVHLAHAAAANRRNHFVRPQSGTLRQRHDSGDSATGARST